MYIISPCLISKKLQYIGNSYSTSQYKIWKDCKKKKKNRIHKQYKVPINIIPN